MMRKKLFPAAPLALAAVLMISGCSRIRVGGGPGGNGSNGQLGGSAGAETPTPLPPLPTREVAAIQSIASDGALALNLPPVALAFDTTGRIATVNVQPGQPVKVGAVLATLDDEALRDALAQATEQLNLTEAQIRNTAASVPARQSDIDSAQAALNQAWLAYKDIKAGPTAATVEQALRSWNAAKDSLYSAQIARDSQCGFRKDSHDCKSQEANVGNAYENERRAYSQYLEAQKPATDATVSQSYANVASAQARLKQLTDPAPTTDESKKLAQVQDDNAKTAVDRAQRSLAKAKLLSPCDCTVQDVSAAVGANAGGVAMTLLQTKSIVFKTNNLSERDLGSIQIGNAAKVRLKPYDKDFPAKVTAILPQSSGVQGNVAIFTVVVQLDPAPEQLLPGMTGQVEISVK